MRFVIQVSCIAPLFADLSFNCNQKVVLYSKVPESAVLSNDSRNVDQDLLIF